MVELITAPMRQQECGLPLADAGEFRGEVGEVMGDEVKEPTRSTERRSSIATAPNDLHSASAFHLCGKAGPGPGSSE